MLDEPVSSPRHIKRRERLSHARLPCRLSRRGLRPSVLGALSGATPRHPAIVINELDDHLHLPGDVIRKGRHADGGANVESS